MFTVLLIQMPIIIIVQNRIVRMKTHMNNTQSLRLQNDVVGHQHFLNHQRALHSEVKPVVVTKRREEIKIVKNKKVELNTNPKEHVQHLYSSLYNKQPRSGIDNQNSAYLGQKQLLADKLKRNKYEQAARKDHEQEIRSMHSRISNCKNLQQRRKDNTDPIVNPAYFIKGPHELNAVTINQYSKKVLGINRPQTAGFQRPPSPSRKTKAQQEPAFNPPPPQSFGTMSHYAKERPNSANPSHPKGSKGSEELPGCSFKEILNHIVNHKLFKDVEMKVLYVRLCHQYGEENVEDIWGDLMDELQR